MQSINMQSNKTVTISFDTSVEDIKKQAFAPDEKRFSQESCDKLKLLWEGVKKQRTFAAAIKEEVISWNVIDNDMTRRDFMDSGDYKRVTECIRKHLQMLLPETVAIDDYGKGIISEFDLQWRISSFKDLVNYFKDKGRKCDAADPSVLKEWTVLMNSRRAMQRKTQQMARTIINDWDFAPEPYSEDEKSTASASEIVDKAREKVEELLSSMKKEKKLEDTIDPVKDDDTIVTPNEVIEISILGKRDFDELGEVNVVVEKSLDLVAEPEPNSNVIDLIASEEDDEADKHAGLMKEDLMHLKQLSASCKYLLKKRKNEMPPALLHFRSQRQVECTGPAKFCVNVEIVEENVASFIVRSLSNYRSFIMFGSEGDIGMENDLHMLRTYLFHMKNIGKYVPFCFLAETEWLDLIAKEISQDFKVIPVKNGDLRKSWLVFNVNDDSLNLENLKQCYIVYDLTAY